MRSIRVTQQTWLALTSALAFVTLALLIVLLPVPFVVYSPGTVHNVLEKTDDGTPAIHVERIATHPTSGELFMTTVSVTRSDAQTSLPEALVAYWLPKTDALPRNAVYDPGKTSDEVRAAERLMMDTSQQDAVVAALRQADVWVEQLPVVASVTVSGPANGRLMPGDLILAVDGMAAATPDEVGARIAEDRQGAPVRFTVQREGRVINADVTPAVRSDEPGRPLVGIEVGVGYRYTPRVNFGVSKDIGGPSAGLVFALAVYDQITPDDVLKGRAVAGTGRITPDGRVGSIGGIHEKIAGAENAGADVFLVPAANCRDLAGLTTDLELVRVATLSDAVTGLSALGDPARSAEVPRC